MTMDETRPELSIEAAFPTLTTAALDEVVRPLTARDTLASLWNAPGQDRFCRALAELLLKQPVTPLRKALPGLEIVRDEPLPLAPLSTRLVNAFRRHHFENWSDVLELTPADLLRLGNLGRLPRTNGSRSFDCPDVW